MEIQIIFAIPQELLSFKTISDAKILKMKFNKNNILINTVEL